jgi:hypothetical protein|tara:strand:+ start:845 stop:1105 length:261 start_codon:yes stop_codon:yes gene_type:complete
MASKEEDIRDGQQAKELIEHPIMTKAFNVILNEGYQQWISTKPEEKDLRETLYHQQIAALKHKQVLINTMENGKLLEKERQEKANG